jgi:hypothetical protein
MLLSHRLVTTGLYACLGLGLFLAGCATDQGEASFDALPDVAVADAAQGSNPDAIVRFHDAAVTNKDVAQVLHDAAVGDPDVGLIDTGRIDTGTTIDTLASIDSSALTDGAASPETRPACEMPRYSKNCIEVSLFECGFTAKCENGVISISWHQHACNGDSWVSNYDCTYTCPKGCKHDYVSWTSPGTKLVEDTCNP